MRTNIPLSMETLLLAIFGTVFAILSFVPSGGRDDDARERSSERTDLMAQDEAGPFGAR